MLIRWTFVALLTAAGLATAASPGVAQQNYPNRPVRIIVGFQPGSSSDVAARVVGQKLTDLLKSPVVIENRPGASSDVAAKAVAAAAPDGYTLYLATVANSINFAAKPQTMTDVATKLMPIAQIGEVPNILVVSPDVQAHTIADVIRLAKEKPGELPYASVGSGSALHMAAELFSTMTGVRLLHIPYQGSAAAMADLLTGRTSLMFAPASTVLSFIKAGKLRAIASATSKRLAGMPDLPTAAEQGLPGFESSVWFGLLAPRGLPDPIAKTLETAILQSTASPDVIAQFDKQSIVVIQRNQTDFTTYIKAENEKWAKVIEVRGLKLD
jgi:tripartite-type tricarboxylate transporter receptor subunit TctC